MVVMALGRLTFSVLFTFFVIYSVIPGSHFFSWHPTLMALGYGFFMYQAVAMFSTSALFPDLKKPKRITFHWVLQVLALVCIAAGSSVAFYNKGTLGKAHFVSWHAKLGLLTNVCAFSAALGGIVAKYSNKIRLAPPLTLKTGHAAFGCIVYTCAMFTTLFGLNTDYFNGMANKTYGTSLWKAISSIPLLMFGSTILQVVGSYSPRYRKH